MIVINAMYYTIMGVCIHKEKLYVISIGKEDILTQQEYDSINIIEEANKIVNII